MDNKLHTVTLGGNLHLAAHKINELYPQIVNCIVAMDYGPGDYTVVVYRYPVDATKLDQLTYRVQP